jgi:hypothetical protein
MSHFNNIALRAVQKYELERDTDMDNWMLGSGCFGIAALK